MSSNELNYRAWAQEEWEKFYEANRDEYDSWEDFDIAYEFLVHMYNNRLGKFNLSNSIKNIKLK
jgi:hypothetical protein